MRRDLFGQPIYDAPKARQPELFDARHWFEVGYREAPNVEAVANDVHTAYLVGYEAGRRDLVDGRHGAEGEARAWRANVTVGNVRED
jgi:hypothetical protein